MLHILNILQFCQLYLSKAEKISHLSCNGLYVKISIFHESPPTVLIFYVKLVRFNVPWNTTTGIQKVWRLQCLQKDGHREGKTKSSISNYFSENKFPPLLNRKKVNSYSPWNSPGQNTRVGSLSLLQGIFSTHGSNPGLSHCRQIDYQLSHKGSPGILEGVACSFSRGSSWLKNGTGVSCIAGRLHHSSAIREAPNQKGSGLTDLTLGGYQFPFKYGIDWTQYYGHRQIRQWREFYLGVYTLLPSFPSYSLVH